MELLDYMERVERKIKALIPRKVCEEPMIEHHNAVFDGYDNNVSPDGVAYIIRETVMNLYRASHGRRAINPIR